MSKDKKTNPGLGISPESIEKLLRDAAVREGACPPETIEELRIVEEKLAGQQYEAPPLSELLKRIRKETPTPANVIHIENHLDPCVVDDFSAMAARNGKNIPKEIRDRMDADRSKAEGGNGSRA
jgi:hypothetical protein